MKEIESIDSKYSYLNSDHLEGILVDFWGRQKPNVVNGHLIPNNTIILPFYWGANMDVKYFKDSFTFNPNRFIDSESNFKVEHEHMSFGKRKRIFAESLKNTDNVNIDKILKLSLGNVINSILFGIVYFNTENNEFFEFAEAFEEFVKGTRGWEFRILFLFPIIDNIPIINTYLYKRITRKQRKMREISKIQVEKCKKTYKPDDERPNFIHAFMKETQPNGFKYNYLDSYHLDAMVLDFWLAGFETTYITLRWFIAIVLKYPEIQEKLQGEIDKVIGKDRLIQLSDKANMPYMNAFINEGQRFANIIAFAPKHKCTKDIVINGYLIPKDTLIEPLYWGGNRDEKYFKDPFTFNINRFLDSEGNFKIEHDHMSFGRGKRVCAGKNLADAEIFLIFTSLLQKYKFTDPNGLVDLNSNFSGFLQPKPYYFKIETR
uniref:Cytochrome P450 18a1 (inferred by orthology to a D. melanogaster protein) n=1 Tax=Strongyloides venezuelensis TaxID=75913 RepID=A0A0K0F0P7_STRVS